MKVFAKLILSLWFYRIYEIISIFNTFYFDKLSIEKKTLAEDANV